MEVLAVLSLKGGVGKTTSAIHLAACAPLEDKVVVLDADEEASAARWATFGKLPFPVVKADRDGMAQQVRELQKGAKLVVIDTPPNNRDILNKAGMIATRVLVPVVPTGLDVDRLMPTLRLLRDLEALRGRLDVAVLLTRWDGRKKIAKDAQEQLGKYPLLSAKVRQLARYEESFGSNPEYLNEYEEVYKELLA